MKLTINQDRLVQLSIRGYVSQPAALDYIISGTGRPVLVPGVGGVTYNLRLGDSAFGWAGDHIEPEVSLDNPDREASEAMNILACIGNRVTVTGGDAKGETGYVIGRHSGAEHVMVHMDNPDALERLAVGDPFRIRAWGAGTVIRGFEDVVVSCLDPELLERIAEIDGEGRICVPVAGTVPARLMGSGMGMRSYRGDYDILTQDMELIREHGLDRLRLGDLVLLEDCLNCYGRGVKQGAVSVGVVIHSDSFSPGHGPGVVDILSSPTRRIAGYRSERCNIGDFR